VAHALKGDAIIVTLVLIALLGVVFLKGFSEAIGIAVVLVAAYLVLNVAVIGVGLWDIVRQGHLVGDWRSALIQEHGNPLFMVGAAIVVFP
jgi:hypothetical protein